MLSVTLERSKCDVGRQTDIGQIILQQSVFSKPLIIEVGQHLLIH